MRAADLNPNPDLAIPTLPVICDRCRAGGMAGDAAFSAIPDILAFAPVPVRARADGWTEQHQRAFIAALAITGSPRAAARAIGKHAFGAERLRNARGGREFALAWDAAVDLARERETHRIHANLAELAEKRDSEIASLGDGGRAGEATDPPGFDPEFDSEDRRDYLEAMDNIRQKLLRARRLLLAGLADDPAKRAAWEELCGPVDWDKAERLEPQDNEPGQPHPDGQPSMPHMREPDMLLCNEAGLLGDFTGETEVMDEIRRQVAEVIARKDKADDGET
jgi:hypothetical protein